MHLDLPTFFFFYGKDRSLLYRASHMEEIYPVCLARQDSRPAALQFTSICWIKSLQRTVMVCRCRAAGVYQRTSHKSLTINVIGGNLPKSKTMKKIFEDSGSSKSKLGVWFQLSCGFKKSAQQLLKLQQWDCWH